MRESGVHGLLGHLHRHHRNRRLLACLAAALAALTVLPDASAATQNARAVSSLDGRLIALVSDQATLGGTDPDHPDLGPGALILASQGNIVGALAATTQSPPGTTGPAATNQWGVCYTRPNLPDSGPRCGCVEQGDTDCLAAPAFDADTPAFGEGPRGGWAHQRQQVGDLVVDHTWHPVASEDGRLALGVEVTLANVGSMPMADVRYRRALAVQAEPGNPAGTTVAVSLQGADVPTPLAALTDFGLASGSPSAGLFASDQSGSGRNCTLGPGSVSRGPEAVSRSRAGCAAGATFDLDLGYLEMGGSRVFGFVLAATDGLVDARNVMGARPAGFGASAFAVFETPHTSAWGVTGLRGPTARLQTPQGTLCAGAPITLTDASTPGDWPVVYSEWDFGDGSVAGYAFQGTTRHTWDQPGLHTARLTVNDANGWAATTTGTFRIETCSADGVALTSSGPAAPATARTAGDLDGDGILDPYDDCRAVPNADQADQDHDGMGDACDQAQGATTPATAPVATVARPASSAVLDADRDGVADTADNCPRVPNRQQSDLDADGQGDLCDADLDGDGVLQASADRRTALDNCPSTPNTDQHDLDHDLVGDACDTLLPAVAAAKQATVVATAPAPARASLGLAVAGILAGAAVLALGARRAIRRGWIFGGLGLFSRLREAEVLEHPVRREIMQRLEVEPGLHCQALVRKLDRHRGLVEHHLNVLVKNGHLKEVKTAGYLCYYPANQHDRAAMEAASLIRSPLARSVLEAIVRSPGTTIPALTKQVGAEYGAVSYHVKRFEGAGLIQLIGSNGHTQALPQALAIRALGLGTQTPSAPQQVVELAA